MSIDCLFFAEATSKEVAVKTARNLLGPYTRQIRSEWATEVCQAINKNPYVDSNEREVVTDKLQKSLDQLHSLSVLSAFESIVQELVNTAKVAQMQLQAGIKAPAII